MSTCPELRKHKLPDIVETADGSKTLFCPHYQQTYHSVHGALTESRYVFIEASDLPSRLSACRELHLLEIGFGTGLNYLLAAQLAERAGVHLLYTALEQRLLPAELLEQLEYGRLLNCTEHCQRLLQYLSSCAYSADGRAQVFLYKNTRLQLHQHMESLFADRDTGFDTIFHDGFSPAQNAELWSVKVFGELYSRLDAGGTLATYSASGKVRRAMSTAGFSVTRLPGPPGKREMLLGKKLPAEQ